MRGNARELRFVTLLTVARFPLILVFLVAAIVYDRVAVPWIFVLAFTSLVASAVTDLFDGLLARRFGVETEFGAHADPLMDKFFYLATLPLLVFVTTRNAHVPHAIALLLVTVMFLTRDQWVTFLRSIGAIYNVNGGAKWPGKLRTCISFPLIAAIYMYEECPVRWIPPPLLYACEAVALVVNVISLCTYTRFYWPYLRRAASLRGKEQPTP